MRRSLAAGLAALLLAVAPAATGKAYGNVVVAEVTSIYDADTFRVNIPDWPPIIGERVPVRVKGIDAPELRGRCREEIAMARAAKEYTVNALRTALHIELRNIERGKYFRILADVYVDGTNLGELLIAAGHARPYDGGRRESWCAAR